MKMAEHVLNCLSLKGDSRESDSTFFLVPRFSLGNIAFKGAKRKS